MRINLLRGQEKGIRDQVSVQAYEDEDEKLRMLSLIGMMPWMGLLG